MTTLTTGAASANPSARFFVREHHPENGTLLGFWLYLMSDCLVFASLFAAYAVLGRNYAGGATGAVLVYFEYRNELLFSDAESAGTSPKISVVTPTTPRDRPSTTFCVLAMPMPGKKKVASSGMAK